jgi:hypothetical protein
MVGQNLEILTQRTLFFIIYSPTIKVNEKFLITNKA